MKKLFKPYFTFIVFLGLMLLYRAFSSEKLVLNFIAILFILMHYTFEYYETELVENVHFSMNSSVVILTISVFGLTIPIIANILSNIVTTLKRRKYNSRELLIRVSFNIATTVICLSIADLTFNFLNINLNDTKEAWKLAVVIMAYEIMNLLLITLVVSFHSGKLVKITNTKGFIIQFISIIIASILSIYVYYDRGLFGLLLVNLILAGFQYISYLHMKLMRKEEELFLDELTKTYNYKYFEVSIQRLLSNKECFTLTMIDLDKFKYINDTYGHSVGNHALKEIATIISRYLDDESILCRFGGDEFCILRRGDKELISLRVERIIEEVKKHQIIYDDYKFNLSLSVGLYCSSGKESSLDEVVNHADAALYQSKNQGGNIAVHKQHSELYVS